MKTFLGEHTCGREERSRFVTSSWLAARFDEELRKNPNISVVDFMALVRKHYFIDVTKDRIYKAKQMAEEKIQGSIEEQYEKLCDYCSTILVKTTLRGEDPVFRQCMYAFMLVGEDF